MKIFIADFSHIVCHPKIQNIYTLSLETEPRKNYAMLSNEMLILVQKNTPTHTVKLSEKTYGFFSNWDLLAEFSRRGIKKITTILHSTKKAEDVYEWAVRSEISKSLLSSHSEPALKYLYKILESNPHIQSSTLKKPSYRSSIKSIQMLTGLSRSQVRYKVEEPKGVRSNLQKLLDDGDE